MSPNSNRRREPRSHNFTNKTYCHIISHDKTKKLQIEAVDVSIRGFGFFSTVSMALGKHCWLDIGGHYSLVEIVYCESHLGLSNKFRVGVFARDEGANLLKLCLDQNILIQDTEPN